ncbi:O-acyltransferase like protein-like [Anticarsia gemmatalis]|uniref:O-acyltransferase like protein-like n=1 Tax=Anticarsia gemmatalis TaxID=129554 RepID=UPI003F76716F
MDQTFRLPRSEEQQEWSTFNPVALNLDKATIDKIKDYNLMRSQMQALVTADFDTLEGGYNGNRTISDNPLSGTVFTLAVCVPKPCTTQQAMDSLFFNVTSLGFNYTDNYCRLPNDKPWSGADTAAVVVFSVIGLLTLSSTCYDLCYRFILKKDIKQVNPIYQSCSLYTNSQRLTTFNYGPTNLNCIDGIRALSMMWIILGHSFGTEPFTANPIEAFMWMFSEKALWVTVATAGVDTFFTLSGILIVYTTAGKMSGITLLKNLHWFYISRLVRLTPLLAVTVLLQASYFNRMTDGPFWQTVETQTNRCREKWWATLLNIQNINNVRAMCAGHSWYIAIDFQLYLLSPLVLFWVLSGKRRNAWLALFIALFSVLIASTIYNFNQNLQAGTAVPTRTNEEMWNYMRKYYFFTLTRAAPFLVGLIFGYILHIFRGQKIKIPWALAFFFWACSGAIIGCIFYFKYLIKGFNWDNQFMDNFMNSYMRGAWAVAVGLVIFTCVHGYGGPVNWFLSLNIWRLPARLSYGMYLLHYPLMFSINGTVLTPLYFSTFKYLSYLALSIMVSFFFTVLVDSPFAALYKQLMITVQKKKPASVVSKVEKDDDLKNETSDEDKVNEVIESKEIDVPAIAIK